MGLAQLRARGADAADLPSDAHAMREPEAGNVYLRRLRYGSDDRARRGTWHARRVARSALRAQAAAPNPPNLR